VTELSVEPELVRWSERFAARTRSDVGAEIAQILALAARTDVISFAGGIPDPVTFPGRDLAAILAELAETGDVTAFQYGPTEGLASTRGWLADRLERLEGRRPGEGELMVTSGGIEALELLGKAFLDPGDVVAVEAPTYLGAIMSVRSFEADVAGFAVDDDGLDPGSLETELAKGLRPKFLYTIPDHQNPAGVTLSAERRAAVAELARRYGFLVVEDVAYRELTFTPDRPPAMWATAPDVVLQIGTFSKTFMPGTRLGWAAGPADVVAKLAWAKQLTDQCPSGLGQRLLEEYGRRGLLDEQIARANELYGSRCAALLAALEAELGDRARWTRPRGGFFSWAVLPGVDALDLAARGADAGVAVVPGSPFYADERGGDAVRLSFSRAGEDEIAEGVRRLAALL
jgi:2-aminoadipate transaminase